MTEPKLKRQPVASTSRPKRKRIIPCSSEEEDNSMLDMVQTRSARRKAKERKFESSETGESLSELNESIDESEVLSDEETLQDSDQIFSDDSDEFLIATRSKRRVNRINYSDEKYFRSRLGSDTYDPNRKRAFPEDEAKKNRSSSKLNNSYIKKNPVSVVAYKKSKYYEESDCDEEENSSDHFNQEGSYSEKNSDQDSEDDESEDDDPIIDPISSTRANNSQFISAHIDWCKKCGGAANRYHIEKGPLVLCEYCSFSYHSTCYSRKTTNSKVICQQCSKTDSHVSKCMICHKEPIGKGIPEDSTEDLTSDLDPEDSQIFFRCLNCFQAIHESCMPILDEEETLEDKLKSYRESWKCHFCIKWEDKVDKILTYRKLPASSNNKEGSMEISESQSKNADSDNIEESDNIEDYEFLVKFVDLSYIQVEWVPGPWLFGVNPTKYNYYIRSQPEPLTKEEVIQDNWTKIHRILDVQFKSEVTLRDQLIKGQKTLGRGVPVQAYVKWKCLGYADATWEPVKNLNKKKFDKAYHIRKNAYVIEKPDIFANRTFAPHTTQPAYLKQKKYDNILNDYQLDGVNWLLHNWCNEISCILADEMGLGKTIQIIVFLLILYKERKCYPFLVVAPKSTTAGWSREFKRWARELNVIEYHGDRESMKVIEDLEMFPDGTNLKCHVVITTPEAIQQHTNTFLKVPLWEVLVVDEAHNLKRGESSLLFKTLNKRFNVYHKVLLTGTPMMNCIDELFNLLKFLGHKEFDNPKELAEEYQGLPTVDQLPALHKLLKTYFLRRTKSQVNLGLPPMDDVIVRVSMTSIQKTIYKETFEKNADFLKQVSRANRSTGFTNILMSLRQIVCHPYLINREEIDPDEERTTEQEEERKKKLVETSGKLILLRDMLVKLHGTEHRVLIFSQFVSMLSILEEFLEDLGYKYVKLDGGTDNELRQYNINAFQAPDSDIFIFLLSTRAGGVGLNLMAADTVFIFDPDFNPHQDIQALSRVHRIGQFKPVKVFRFITQFSIEEKIVERGKIKLAKNELVVEKMDNEILDVQEVDDIIRYGAKALFSEDENEKPVGLYTDEAVEKLLDRSQMKAAELVTESKNLTGFAFARIWDTESQEVVEDKITSSVEEESVESRDFWTKLLAHVANSTTAEAPIQGRGARKRNKVDYYEGDVSMPKKKQGKKRSIDPDFIPTEKEIVSSESESDDSASDPLILEMLKDINKKPVSSKGSMISKKRKDDDQKLRSINQNQDNYMHQMRMPIMITGAGFQNMVTLPPIGAESTMSFNHDIYNHGSHHFQYQWCLYDYQIPQPQIHQMHQMQMMQPPPLNEINTEQNMTAVEGQRTLTQNISEYGPNLPQSSNYVQATQEIQSNVHKPDMHNHVNISTQSVVPMQPEHHNLQSQAQQHQSQQHQSHQHQSQQHQSQQYQSQQQAKVPNEELSPRNVVIKEVSAEVLKRKVDKSSSSKVNNGLQALSNLQEPVVVISDDEMEGTYRVPQNRIRKIMGTKKIRTIAPMESSPVNNKTSNGSKNKGKQVASKINSRHNYTTHSTITNDDSSQDASNFGMETATGEKVGEFVRLFDEIQMSEEDFGLRLIAITRLYQKLVSLDYDIEGHITSLAADGKLDHDLLKSFRDA